MKKPRKIQKYPEMYIWDYSDRYLDSAGVGVLIVYPGEDKHGLVKGELLHFNQWWLGYNTPTEVKENRRLLNTKHSNFKYAGEIK